MTERTQGTTWARVPLGTCSRRAATLLFAALLLTAPARGQEAAPAAAGVSADRLERLTTTLQGYVDRGELPGAVALIARRGEVIYEEALGYRDREAGAPQATTDLFRIASQTKAIVSVAVMMLHEEGRLLLSDPVGRHLPAFRETRVAEPLDGGGYRIVDAARPITLRDLLTHTAGIGYGGGVAGDLWVEAGIQGWYFADRNEPIRSTVDRMAALPFEAHPGERFVYGYATDILGAVVEAASGVSLDVFLSERIFQPLGMVDTHFYVPPSKESRLSVVYSVTDEGLTRAPDPGGMVGQGAYARGPRRSFSGGAGLVSTAWDYFRFLQMMLDGGTLDGARILSRKSVELMTVDHVGDLAPTPGTGFGLGFQVIEDLGAFGSLGSVGAYGWGGAYHSTYWVDPAEELVVVYFTQVIPATGLDDHARLRALVYQALEG